MEVHLTTNEVSALLFNLANDTHAEKGRQATPDDLRLAMRILSYLIVTPNGIGHASTLPAIIARATGSEENAAQVYDVLNRFSAPMSVFCESDMAYVSINLASSQNDPWETANAPEQ